MNRRNFIKTSAVGIAAMTLPQSKDSWRPFDEEIALIGRAISNPRELPRNFPQIPLEVVKYMRNDRFAANSSEFFDYYNKNMSFCVLLDPDGVNRIAMRKGVVEVHGIEGGHWLFRVS